MTQLISFPVPPNTLPHLANLQVPVANLQTGILQPFESDEEYIAFAEFALNLQRVAYEVSEKARGMVGEREREKERDREYMTKVGKRLEVMAERAHSLCDLRAEKGIIII